MCFIDICCRLQATATQKKEGDIKDSTHRQAFSGKPRVLSNEASSPSTSGPQSSQNVPGLPESKPAEIGGPSEGASPRQPSAQEEVAAVSDSRTSSQHAVEIADEQVQVAVIQLNAAPGASKEVLRKILANILRQPDDPKFRRIRLANARIKETIVDVEGALELLQVCSDHPLDPLLHSSRNIPFSARYRD